MIDRSNDTCPSCGLQWCPHDLQSLAAQFSFFARDTCFRHYNPDWLAAEWLRELCGTCAGVFMNWATYAANRRRPRFQPELLFHEGEYCFTKWVLERFNKALKQYERNGRLTPYCVAPVRRSSNCRNPAAPGGKFCEVHRPGRRQPRRTQWQIEQDSKEIEVKRDQEEFWS
jgi:hypothetical protein